jgi:glycogen debranching enzyme
MATAEAIAEIHSIAQQDYSQIASPEGYFLAAARHENFGALFGRDGLICSRFALESFKLHPENHGLIDQVKGTLVVLAKYQGNVVDDRRDEEPGKIGHELRYDSNPKNQEYLRILMANGWPVDEDKNGMLSMRYYGSVDSTVLFVEIACDYIKVDEGSFGFLDPHIRRAVDWIENYGDSDGDYYIEYDAKNREALLNQGWKDSGNSIIAEGPVALVEVQGYQYAALIKAADLYEKIDPDFSASLKERAKTLKERFNKDFWIEDENFFAHGLDGKKNQVLDITSNVGHLLASGIIDDEKLSKVIARLMQPDLFTRYGVRTLSVNSPRFSDIEPDCYHNGGGVWPHDNVLIYHGLKKAGFFAEAARLRDAILDAQYTLKLQYGIANAELYIVDRMGSIRPYYGACLPQGWVVTAMQYLADSLETKQFIAA